jgi:eukaryotic-like serine/threonine-protein kinase
VIMTESDKKKSSNKITLPDFKKWIKPTIHLAKYGVIALVILIVVFLLFDQWLLPVYTRHNTEFPLPNLLGKSFDEATSIAEDAHFELIIRSKQPSSNIPEGTILSMVPSSGTQIKANRKVKVIISAGEEMSEVPELARFSVRQAELKLPEFGLKVKNYFWTETDSLAKDVIAYTIPPAGSLVPKNSGIDLYINRGYQSNEGYVPKLVGKPLEEVRLMLDTLGFPEARVEFVTNPMLLPKIVTYQHPAAGTKIKIDSVEILLVVPVGE